MDNLIEKIKKDTSYSSDIIIRKIKVFNTEIDFVFSEVLCNGTYINDFILENIVNINNNDIFKSIYNTLPSNNVKIVSSYKEIINYIFQGFCIVIINNKYMAIEARAKLDKGITSNENEVSIIGPNESFTENFNTNLGLIRKRIRSSNVVIKDTFIGKETNTKVGICYMSTIADINLVNFIYEKLKKINIDGIIDTGYIKELITNKEKIFSTVIITERPDTASISLLEGKVVIIVDNSPFVIILPTFFIDFFHTPDDYYQKSFNTTFIRIIRLLAFLIAILFPAFYISVTTHNPESIPLNLLTNFASQRLSVPFPGFIEALIMIICFEILRESDTRSPSKVGTSISILGGLILGEAAVKAGIVSPIMIIVIAISMISGLIFTTNTLTYSIRYYRILLLILSAFFGLFGVFIGIMLVIIKLCSINTFGYSYMFPITPLYINTLKDSFVKIKNKKNMYRNELLSKKNLIRGKFNEKN